MKKSKLLVLLLMLTFVIGSFIGCKGIKEENNQSNESKEEVDYKALYKEEVDKLIGEFGKYENPASGGIVKGVKYGELIDFNNDEVPEMIILHDKQVLLYTIEDDKLKCVYEGTVGSRYAQSDVSYNFGINDKGEEVYIVINDSEATWTEEVISIVTMKDKEVVIKKLNAKTAPDNDRPIRENLISFYIDDKEVSKEEYDKIYDSIVNNCKTIDVAVDNSPEKAVAELERFLQSLQ